MNGALVILLTRIFSLHQVVVLVVLDEGEVETLLVLPQALRRKI